MNKYIRNATTLIISGLMTISPLTAFAQTAIKLNGVSQNISIEPIQQDGATLVGLREFGKIFGAYIEWLPNSQETLIQKGDVKAIVKVGSKTATVNDQKVLLSAEPTLVDGTLMVSLDLITQMFKVDVNVDPQNNSISIVDGDEEKILVVPSRNGITVTYDQILEKLIASSDDLKTIVENLETAIDSRDTYYDTNIGDSVSYEPTGLDAINSLLNQDISIKSSKLKENLQKVTIEYTAKTTIDSIINSEANIVLSKMNLEDSANNLEITKKKYELGLVSKLEFDNAQTAYDKSVNSLKNLQDNLKTFYNSLNLMLDVDADTVYNINYTPEYVPTEVASLEGYINAKVAESATVITAEYNVEKAQNTMKLSIDTPYDSRKNSLAQAERSLNNTKDNLKKKMNDAYTAIKQLEKDRDLAITDLSDARRDYDLAKTQYNLGLTSQVELNKAKLAVASKEYSLQSTLTKLVEKNFQFQNPDLL